MANEEHLAILKQGVKAWNAWVRERREQDRSFTADLSEADLFGADLSGAAPSTADLGGTYLMLVDFVGVDLRGADLSRANLGEAYLGGANLNGADLNGAILRGADLRRADVSGANLSGAHLMSANLMWANLGAAYLGNACLTDARVGYTVFANLDLSQVKGLEETHHHGPSTIGIDTLYRSKGKIPRSFLKGAGVPDDLIDYIDAFICGKPIQFYSCFISYSSKDQEFADRIHADMQSKGLRVWFAPDDLKWGDEIREGIDQAIRRYDRLVVILSEHSVDSAWVKKEVETAFEEETRRGRLVLFPIRVDDTVMATERAWAADLRRMRNIGDFRAWKDHDAYKNAFDRLLRDLIAEPG